MMLCMLLLFALFLYFGREISALKSKILASNKANLKRENLAYKLKFLNTKPFKWLFAAILTLFCQIPIFQNYSANALIYAFFDKPCLFLTLFLGVFIVKILLKDLFDKDLKLNLNLKSTFTLLFFNSFLFLSYLNILNFDIYHASIFIKSLFCFVFLLILFANSQILALLALFSLALNFTQNPLDSLFCAYLWAFSLASFLILLKGKLCKNPLKV